MMGQGLWLLPPKRGTLLRLLRYADEPRARHRHSPGGQENSTRNGFVVGLCQLYGAIAGGEGGARGLHPAAGESSETSGKWLGCEGRHSKRILILLKSHVRAFE